MANPLAQALKIVQTKVMRILPMALFWLALSVGTGVVAAQFTENDLVIHEIGFGAAFLLLFLVGGPELANQEPAPSGSARPF